jgi:hypothetical protein
MFIMYNVAEIVQKISREIEGCSKAPVQARCANHAYTGLYILGTVIECDFLKMKRHRLFQNLLFYPKIMHQGPLLPPMIPHLKGVRFLVLLLLLGLL